MISEYIFNIKMDNGVTKAKSMPLMLPSGKRHYSPPRHFVPRSKSKAELKLIKIQVSDGSNSSSKSS